MAELVTSSRAHTSTLVVITKTAAGWEDATQLSVLPEKVCERLLYPLVAKPWHW